MINTIQDKKEISKKLKERAIFDCWKLEKTTF